MTSRRQDKRQLRRKDNTIQSTCQHKEISFGSLHLESKYLGMWPSSPKCWESRSNFLSSCRLGAPHQKLSAWLMVASPEISSLRPSEPSRNGNRRLFDLEPQGAHALVRHRRHWATYAQSRGYPAIGIAHRSCHTPDTRLILLPI